MDGADVVTPGPTCPPGILNIRKNTQKSKFLLSQAFKWAKILFFVIPQQCRNIFLKVTNLWVHKGCREVQSVPDHSSVLIQPVYVGYIQLLLREAAKKVLPLVVRQLSPSSLVVIGTLFLVFRF